MGNSIQKTPQIGKRKLLSQFSAPIENSHRRFEPILSPVFLEDNEPTLKASHRTRSMSNNDIWKANNVPMKDLRFKLDSN